MLITRDSAVFASHSNPRDCVRSSSGMVVPVAQRATAASTRGRCCGAAPVRPVAVCWSAGFALTTGAARRLAVHRLQCNAVCGTVLPLFNLCRRGRSFYLRLRQLHREKVAHTQARFFVENRIWALKTRKNFRPRGAGDYRIGELGAADTSKPPGHRVRAGGTPCG